MSAVNVSMVLLRMRCPTLLHTTHVLRCQLLDAAASDRDTPHEGCNFLHKLALQNMSAVAARSLPHERCTIIAWRVPDTASKRVVKIPHHMCTCLDGCRHPMPDVTGHNAPHLHAFRMAMIGSYDVRSLCTTELCLMIRSPTHGAPPRPESL